MQYINTNVKSFIKEYRYQQALTLWLYCGIIKDGYCLDSNNMLTEASQEV